jgi:hypothetical protein
MLFMGPAVGLLLILRCVAHVSCNALRNKRQLHFIPALKAGLVLYQIIQK